MDTRATFTIGAFAVIFDREGRVLLCHRQDMDAWNLPGGGMETGEMPDECVQREIREETGLEARVERLVGIYGKADRDELVFTFICHITGGEMRLTEESDANAYFFPDQLPPNTLLKHAERIIDAVALLKSDRPGEAAKEPCLPPVMRVQGGLTGSWPASRKARR